jgi:hypothetical protein
MCADKIVTALGFGIAVSTMSGIPTSETDPIVGYRNHRYFLLFILFLMSGIISFDILTVACRYSILYSLSTLTDRYTRKRTGIYAHAPMVIL